MTTFAGMTSAQAAADFSGTHYAALVSAAGTHQAAGTELSGNGYTRVAFTWTVTVGTNTSTAVPSGDIIFPTPTASWTTAVALEIYSAATNGTRRFSFPLSANVTGLAGKPPTISATQLSITLGGAQV